MENVSKEMLERSDEMISKMTADEIRALFEENDKLRQELRIRDNDILSHDQVFEDFHTQDKWDTASVSGLCDPSALRKIRPCRGCPSVQISAGQG